MSHEVSETIQDKDGRWINVYGKGLPKMGKQLPGTRSYDSVEEAVGEAKARSANHGRDAQYQAYMREVRSYLSKVKGGRRVPAADPQDPKFSQQADDERQARRAGLGSHIKFGPPAPAFNQVAPPPSGSMATAPSTGRAAPSPVWGFHEPTLTAAEGAGKAIGKAGEVMSDPRNAWIGLGPIGVLGKMGGVFRKTIPDAGGFHVPTSKMIKDDSGMAAPSHGMWEAEKRDDYLFGRRLENEHADTLMRGPHGQNREAYIETMDRYKSISPSEQENVNHVIVGRQALQDEIDNAMRPNAGGSRVPPEMRKKYGFR